MSTLSMNSSDRQPGEMSAKVAINDYSKAFAHGSTSCPYPALNINVVHQRRRVNPESLAQRLGPDLVRDLDALITPGNTEMPSFAVRKELQERYNIDRRHIYDYFHSRGLRVVKEDKHGHAMTPKEPVPTPLPNLRRVRQPHLKSFPSHPSHPVTTVAKWTPKPRGITKAKPGRPKRSLPASPRFVSSVREAGETKDVTAAYPDHTPSLPSPTYIVVNPLLSLLPLPHMAEEDEDLTFNSIANPLDESFSVTRAIGDVAYSYRHKLVFQRMQELNEYPNSSFADDSPLPWNETSPCSVSEKGLLLPHVKALTPDERQAIYKTLSESLGPARGIQECQGTYRKHMEGRTKLYFEGLLSVPCHHSQQSSKASTSADPKPTMDTNEFRHWLSEVKFLERDGMNGAPRFHHNDRNANVARQYGVHTSTERPFGQRSIPRLIQTLDDLFPTPVLTLKSELKITDSPVVRTREPPCTAPLFSSALLGDEFSEGDQSLFSGSFSPTLSALPETSLAEAGQNCRTQFHGLAGFPGSQESTTRVAAVDPNDPQKSERSQCSHALVVLQPNTPEVQIARCCPENEPLRKARMSYLSARTRFAPCSPCKPLDRDRIRTRSITSRDARRRTPSAAGGI